VDNWSYQLFGGLVCDEFFCSDGRRTAGEASSLEAAALSLQKAKGRHWRTIYDAVQILLLEQCTKPSTGARCHCPVVV
jgi:hypothetical protein